MSKHELFVARAIVEVYYDTREEALAAMDYMDREIDRLVGDGCILPDDALDLEWGTSGDLERHCNYCGQRTDIDFVECCDGSTSK
jgi:hypothetical protein